MANNDKVNYRQQQKVELVTGSGNKKKEGEPRITLCPGSRVLTLQSK
jgi:hypothetical protein